MERILLQYLPTMTDYKHKLKSTPSRLLAGFGAVTPRQNQEDCRQVREDMEEAVSWEVNKEDDNK
jgi:hypothetical protein